MATIADNLRVVRDRIGAIARSAGRDPASIQLVAVSKTFGIDAIQEALSAGQQDFGENYAREFRGKQEALSGLGVRWHFIGHLQSNKAKEVVGRAHLIHSLDRTSLAREIQKRADRMDVTVDALIEVHTTGESTKSGVLPENVAGLVRDLSGYDRLRIRGLMTMGPFTDDPEDSRKCFVLLRDLRDRLREDAPAGMTFDELSMGMTADHAVAIEEGATILRIGTAIFGQRNSHEA